MQQKRAIIVFSVCFLFAGGIFVAQHQSELSEVEDSLLAKHTQCAAYAEIAGIDPNSVKEHSTNGYSEDSKKELHRQIAKIDIEKLREIHGGMSHRDAAGGIYHYACKDMLEIQSKQKYSRQASI